MRKVTVAVAFATLVIGCVGTWLVLGIMSHVYLNRFGN